MVALTGSSSKLEALVKRLPTSPPADHSPARKRQAQRRLSVEQVRQLVVAYQAGASMQTLATRWGLHRTTVAEHLRRAGVTSRRRGVPVDKRTELIRLYDEGWSCQRLAGRYGCDAETVRQALKRAGVTRRKPCEFTPKARYPR